MSQLLGRRLSLGVRWLSKTRNLGIINDMLRIVSCMSLLLLLVMTMVVRISKRWWWHETRLRSWIGIGGSCKIRVRQCVCGRYTFRWIKL